MDNPMYNAPYMPMQSYQPQPLYVEQQPTRNCPCDNVKLCNKSFWTNPGTVIPLLTCIFVFVTMVVTIIINKDILAGKKKAQPYLEMYDLKKRGKSPIISNPTKVVSPKLNE